jgi:hypothetical protein
VITNSPPGQLALISSGARTSTVTAGGHALSGGSAAASGPAASIAPWSSASVVVSSLGVATSPQATRPSATRPAQAVVRSRVISRTPPTWWST